MDIGKYISSIIKFETAIDVDIDFYNLDHEEFKEAILKYQEMSFWNDERFLLELSKEDVESILNLDKKYICAINFINKIQVFKIDPVLVKELSRKMKKYDLCNSLGLIKSDICSNMKENLIRKGAFDALEVYDVMAEDPIFYDRYIGLCSIQKLKELSKSKDKKIAYLALSRLGPCESLDDMLDSKYAKTRQLGAYLSPFGYKKLESMIDDRSAIVRQIIIEKLKTSLIPFLFSLKNSNISAYRKSAVIKALKERMK
jgi:hypothetical protein